MSDTHCDVCGEKNSFGCGHSGPQRRDARRHAETRAHKEGRCWHYDHRGCDPATCKLANKPWPEGYAPFVHHRDAK